LPLVVIGVAPLALLVIGVQRGIGAAVEGPGIAENLPVVFGVGIGVVRHELEVVAELLPTDSNRASLSSFVDQSQRRIKLKSSQKIYARYPQISRER
jgi:hypothetical protein